MRWCLFIIKAAVALVLFSVEALFWFLHGVKKVVRLTADMMQARKRLPAGVLCCPKGHAIKTEREKYQCTLCGFVYTDGSIWLCPNKECGAVTLFVDCTTCGVSVPSPYRWG